jgi:disease resistance protein RPM1
VIDDVWSEAAWDAIQCVLPDNNCGSRIIVTIRIDTVARACSHASDCIYHIKPLSPEDSKRLFLSRVFGSTNGAYPMEIEDVMQKILRKCGGLPLAIVSIASLLASYKSPESKHMWETVLKSIGSHMESHPTLEGMRRIVVLSYNHLPHHLKSCMMYLSIFPEDFVIVKERLLRRWIAEGLVAEKRGLTSMEVAEAYFNELVSRSMIDRAADIVTYYDGREETCGAHDMVLEVMVTKSLEANFVSLIGGQYEGMPYDRVRRLSIHAREGPSSISSKKTKAGHGRRNGINRMNVQHVRSLSMFEFEGHHLLSRLGEFTLLRVLDLQDCRGLGKRHMAYICRMYLLRLLNLRGTDISVLPPEVGQLEHLQTLDVRRTFFKGLPDTVTELESLENLQFSNKDHYWSFHWEAPESPMFGVGN